MSHQHMNPEEAILVHMDLKAKYSIGVHWGTFLMSDEHYLDPPKEFEKARLKYDIERGQAFTSTFGKTVTLIGNEGNRKSSDQSLNTLESFMSYSLQSLNTADSNQTHSDISNNATPHESL